MTFVMLHFDIFYYYVFSRYDTFLYYNHVELAIALQKIPLVQPFLQLLRWIKFLKFHIFHDFKPYVIPQQFITQYGHNNFVTFYYTPIFVLIVDVRFSNSLALSFLRFLQKKKFQFSCSKHCLSNTF